ncbi:MAG: hypothetical protein ACE5KV_01080 [Thermoplasmata archaeon]
MSRERQSAVDIFATMVVILILVVLAVGFLLYQRMSITPHTSPSYETVDERDEVKFNYVGYYEDNTVFETTIKEVAQDNVSYPKSLLFLWPESNKFEPVMVIIGQGISGENFTGMVDRGKVLEDALIGMKEGDTATVWVDPEEGFEYPDPLKIETRSLIESVEQTQVMLMDDFFQRYHVEIIPNATFVDPFWGWPVRVIWVDPDTTEVTIRNQPAVGEIVSPYKGFQSEVIAIDSGANEGRGEITVKHLLTEEDAGNVMGVDPAKGKFAVNSVNESSGTFQADFNSEKAGKRLRYEITVVSILKR